MNLHRNLMNLLKGVAPLHILNADLKVGICECA